METIIDQDNNQVDVQGDVVVLTPVAPEPKSVNKDEYLAIQQANLVSAQADLQRLTDNETAYKSQLDTCVSQIVDAQKVVDDIQNLINALSS